MIRFASLFITILIAPAVANDEAVRVRLVPLEQLLIKPQISAPATVVGLNDSRISAELNARIIDIEVRAGDTVVQDQILVQLDCSDYQWQLQELQARLETTQARLNFARAQVERAKPLQRQRALSEEILQQRETELASLLGERQAQQALLGLQQRKLDRCQVRAPFKAVVTERLASVGEYAMPGTPLVHLMDIDQLEVSAAVIAEDADDLQADSAPVLDYRDQQYLLRLRSLTPVIDARSRTREARLLFTAAPAIPGASGRLIWHREPSLPADLLVRRDGQLGVLIARDGRARFHPLPQAQEGQPAGVALPPWTKIITDGRLGVRAGDLIQAVD